MTEIATGTDHIREALLARQNVWALIAHDCAIGIDRLDTFANGRAELSVSSLEAIADWVFHGHITFNAAANALEPANTEPARSMGTPPDEFYLDSLPRFQRGPNPNPGPQPEIAAPKPKKKAGWLGGW